MGILDRAIKRGVNRALGSAVETAVTRAVSNAIEPTLQQGVNRVVGQPTAPPAPAAVPQASPRQQEAALGSALGTWASAVNSYATEAAKNVKCCPACGTAAGASETFCPSCGARLPEQTLAQGAVCAFCGKQNAIGTRFCTGCGAKLPAAQAEEASRQAQDEAALASWDTLLPQYPKWQCGGHGYLLELQYTDDAGNPCYGFTATDVSMAQVQQYRSLLVQAGFVQAGRSPLPGMLYKRVNGIVYCADSDSSTAPDGAYTIFFSIREPDGGFDYRRPEPGKGSGLRGLFGL